jgi:hypothetical protein
MQEIRARKQQMQTAALQQQQVQMEIDRTKAVNQAYQDAFSPQPDGTVQLDTNKLTTALAKNGHGEAIPGIMEGYTKYQQSLANLRETNGKVAAAEADAAGNLAATVQAAKNDPALFHSLLTDAINRKIIDQTHFAPLDQQLQQAMQADPTGEQARALVGQFTTQMIAGSPKQQELANARTTAQARKQEADTSDKRLTLETPKIQAETTAAQQKASGTEPIQPADQAKIDLEKTGQANTEAYRAKELAQGAGRLSVEQEKLKLQKEQFGFDTNGGVSSTAKAIVNGDLDPQTVRSMLRRNPGLVEQAKRLDPTWDEANIDSRYETLKEFTNTSVGKAGGQSIALNTLIHHADLYQRVGEALKNGSFRPGNALYNEVSTLFGGPAPTNTALVARFLAGETGKVATGGVPAEGEINGILQKLSTDNSPDQLVNAGKTILQIAAGRATPLMERVHQNKLDNQIHVIGPDAKEILQRRGFDPETMKPVQQGGGGGTPAIPASIPGAARSTVHYSPSTKMFYYTTDGGKTWQTAKP